MNHFTATCHLQFTYKRAIVASRQPTGSVACGTVGHAAGIARAGPSAPPAGVPYPAGPPRPPPGGGTPLRGTPWSLTGARSQGPAPRPFRPGGAGAHPVSSAWPRRRLPLFSVPVVELVPLALCRRGSRFPRTPGPLAVSGVGRGMGVGSPHLAPAHDTTHRAFSPNQPPSEFSTNFSSQASKIGPLR